MRKNEVSGCSARMASNVVEPLGVAGAAEPRQHLERQPNANGEPVGVGQPAQRAQVVGASPRVLDGGDPQRGRAAQCALEQRRHLVLGRHREEPVDELDRSFLERAGRPSSGVANDPAIGRVGSAGRDAGGLQRPRVRPAGVAVEALEVGRPVAHHGVELLAVRHAARKGGVQPATPGHPWLLRPRRGVRRDRLLNRIERFHAEQVEPVEAGGSIAQMHVGVVEAGHHQSAGRVEVRRTRPGPFARPPLVSDAQDAAGRDRHGGCGCVGCGSRPAGAEDSAVVDDQLRVGRHRRSIAADGEPRVMTEPS